jgi:hypothetical protein
VSYSDPPPELPGVEHRYITTPSGVRIHVAEAGPADGRAITEVTVRYTANSTT